MLIASVFSLWCSSCPAQTTINVPADQPSIQAGIDAALDGDTVLIASGVYAESIDLLGKSITLHGADSSSTIVDPPVGNAIVCISGEDENTVIQGFTFRGGNGTPSAPGGGIRIEASSPVIEDCSFVENQGDFDFGGGGAFVDGGSPAFHRCSFVDNNGGSRGGGMFVQGGQVALIDCIFQGNVANGGGGLHTWEFTQGTVSGCQFLQNLSFVGGSACFIRGNYMFWNCLVAEGTINPTSFSSSAGIGIFGADDSTNVTIEQCTFANNQTNTGSDVVDIGVLLDANDSVVVRRCIAWGATGGPSIGSTFGVFVPTVLDSCVMGGYPGSGNFATDPLFVTGPSGDYYLSQVAAGDVADSPGLDYGPLFATDACSPIAGACLSGRTTRTDGGGDLGLVDLGFHYDDAFPFVRSDCNSDGSSDIADAVFALESLFLAAASALCEDACDSNDDSGLDISDPIFLLANLFSSGAAPPTPFPGCGSDPTPDGLTCTVASVCP